MFYITFLEKISDEHWSLLCFRYQSTDCAFSDPELFCNIWMLLKFYHSLIYNLKLFFLCQGTSFTSFFSLRRWDIFMIIVIFYLFWADIEAAFVHPLCQLLSILSLFFNFLLISVSAGSPVDLKYIESVFSHFCSHACQLLSVWYQFRICELIILCFKILLLFLDNWWPIYDWRGCRTSSWLSSSDKVLIQQ